MTELAIATKAAAEKLSEVLESARKENPENLVNFELLSIKLRHKG